MDHLAIAQHGDFIAHAEDLVQAVGDQHQRAAFGAQLRDDLGENLGLDIGQRIGGLIHDDDLGVQRQRTRNLDHLLLTDAQLADGGAGIQRLAQAVEQLAGITVQALPVDGAQRGAWLTAEEDVLAGGKARHQIEFLVDDGDAAVHRLTWGGEDHFLVTQPQRAGVIAIDAGENLHQRRLARAILTGQRMHAPRAQRQVDTLEHADPGEALVDALECHQHPRLCMALHQKGTPQCRITLAYGVHSPVRTMTLASGSAALKAS